MANINPRQTKFAEFYAQTGNVVQSALKAGYSDSYANKRAHTELLENVGVKKLIDNISEQAQKERVISAIERQALLSDIAKSQEENTSDRIRAIDVLNRMSGEYIDKVDVSGSLETGPTKLDAILEQLKDE